VQAIEMNLNEQTMRLTVRQAVEQAA
jgi:hypothetical protein